MLIYVGVDCERCILFFKQKTAYEMRISYWSSDVCSSDRGISLAKPSGLHRGEFALRELAVTVRVGCRPVSSGFHACFRRGKLTVPIRIFRRPCCGNPGVMFSSAELSISVGVLLLPILIGKIGRAHV